MMKIVKGELRVKLNDKEAVNCGPLLPIILDKYEAFLRDKAVLIYKIKQLEDSKAKPTEFRFSEN